MAISTTNLPNISLTDTSLTTSSGEGFTVSSTDSTSPVWLNSGADSTNTKMLTESLRTSLAVLARLSPEQYTKLQIHIDESYHRATRTIVFIYACKGCYEAIAHVDFNSGHEFNPLDYKLDDAAAKLALLKDS